jgi:hypothetical protein
MAYISSAFRPGFINNNVLCNILIKSRLFSEETRHLLWQTFASDERVSSIVMV